MKTRLRQVGNFLFSNLMLDKRTRIFTLGTLIADFAFGIGKIIFSTIFLSLYFGLTGIYGIILGSAKIYALNRYIALPKIEDREMRLKKERKSLKKISNFILAASFVYFSLCFVSAFVFPEHSDYNDIFAIFVTTAAFAKLGFGIAGAIRAGKDCPPVIAHIKLINIADGFVAIALAQRALLLMEGTPNAHIYNGIIGIVMSCLAFGISIYMRVRVSKREFFFKEARQENPSNE